MELLERKNIWFWIILFFTGLHGVVFATMFNLYTKNAWYTNIKNWLLALLCGGFPIVIMFMVFVIQSLCISAAKLNIPGKEIYTLPYPWILCIIIPIVGWTLFLIMLLYLNISIIIYIYNLNLEKFTK